MKLPIAITCLYFALIVAVSYFAFGWIGSSQLRTRQRDGCFGLACAWLLLTVAYFLFLFAWVVVALFGDCL